MLEYRVSFTWHTGYENARLTTRKFARQVSASDATGAIEAVRNYAIKRGMPAYTEPDSWYPVWPQPSKTPN
jgi:hypothetical protein